MISVVVAVAFLAALSAAAPQEHYASRYDHLDVENVLNNRRMVNYYAACLLSKGPCPPQGLELKRILPEALHTNCVKCSEKQKTVAYRTIKRLKKEYPKIWDQLQAIWDPDNIYVNKFEASFENPSSVPVVQQVVPVDPVLSENPLIANRFGDDEPAANNVVSSNPSPSPSTDTRTTTTTSTTTIASTTFTTTTKPTNKPVSSVFITNQQQAPPYTTVGANLQATVSFGTNLVGGIVRSLGALGTRVVESGTKIANMMISAVIRP